MGSDVDWLDLKHGIWAVGMGYLEGWIFEGLEPCSKHNLGGVNVGEMGGEKSGGE